MLLENHFIFPVLLSPLSYLFENMLRSDIFLQQRREDRRQTCEEHNGGYAWKGAEFGSEILKSAHLFCNLQGEKLQLNGIW